MCCITILVLSGFKQHIYNCFLYKWCLRERHTLENNLKRAWKSCWGLGLRIESICEWPEGWWSGGVGPDWPEAPTRGQWGKRVVGGVQMVTCDDPSCLETGGFKDSLAEGSRWFFWAVLMYTVHSLFSLSYQLSTKYPGSIGEHALHSSKVEGWQQLVVQVVLPEDMEEVQPLLALPY